jgi:hypothetical protein
MYKLNESIKDGDKNWWRPAYVREQEIGILPDNAKPEAYSFKRLGEDFAVGSLKGSVDYGTEKLRRNTAAMQSVRDKIFKETFRDLDRYCVKRGWKKKAAKMAFFISHEFRPVINSHYMMYRENFDYWYPYLIKDFLKTKFNKRTHSKRGYCELYERREGASYQLYINKKEDKDIDYLKPFFSKGLEDKIKSII